jgi:integrase
MAWIKPKQRKKGKGWQVRWRNPDGTQDTEMFDFEWQAKERKREVEADGGQAADMPSVDRDITVTKLGEDVWLAGIRTTRKPRTVESYEQAFTNHIVPALGTVEVRHLTPGRIMAFLEQKLSEGLAVNSVKLIYATIRRLLSRARIAGVIRTNPAFGLGKELGFAKWQPPSKDEIKAFTPEQLSAFLALAETDPYYPLFFTLSKTGMRLGEALGLHLDDLDLEHRSIHVAKTLHPMRGSSQGFRLGPPKRKKPRDVDMAISLRTVLHQHVIRRREENLHRGQSSASPLDPLTIGDIRKESPWLFATEVGTPLDESRVRKVFAKLLKKAKLPARHTPHSCRHSYITHSLGLNVPVTYIAAQTGDTVQTILAVYSWALPSGDKAHIDRLDALVTRTPVAVEQAELVADGPKSWR